MSLCFEVPLKSKNYHAEAKKPRSFRMQSVDDRSSPHDADVADGDAWWC